MARAVHRKAVKAATQAMKAEIKAAVQAEKAEIKAAVQAEVLDRLSNRLGTLDVWLRTEPGARRPRFTRDDLTAAAVRIADAEGFEAVSMRRIASELDAGTMTLYHYVRTKEELLTLVHDAVMGEVVVPTGTPIPIEWRAALTLIAERTRAAMRRHPWILDITDEPSIGPNSVRHFDQTLEALTSLPISYSDKLDIAAGIDEYTFGYCLFERNNRRDKTTFSPEMIGYVNGLIATGRYPQLAAVTAKLGDEAWKVTMSHMGDPDRFSRNLNRFLDGIEADLVTRRA
jgi:AcrR family transcriptional regulator